MKEERFFLGLSAESTICAYCGYCRPVCPTYAGVGWESCSPRGRIQLTRMLLRGTALSREQSGRLYQCTMCGRCGEVCSTGIDLRRFWLEARAEAAARDLAPKGLDAMRRQVADCRNVYGYPNDERAGWAEYMEDAPVDLYQRARAEVLYFVGCSSSFSPRVQQVAESFVRLLTAARVDFAILGEGEACCGFPLQAAGMADEAGELIRGNLERVLEMGVSTVVFTCPACRLMWREQYAPALPGVRLLHSTELLLELAEAGRLPLKGFEGTVTYHDPCDLARNGGVFDSPRRLLAAVPGLTLVEPHQGRERGECCGGGGDLEMVDPSLAGLIASRRVAQLAATGARTIVTACPQCVRTLTRGAEESGAGVEVLDVAELLARGMGAGGRGPGEGDRCRGLGDRLGGVDG